MVLDIFFYVLKSLPVLITQNSSVVFLMNQAQVILQEENHEESESLQFILD
jgi:hypothetical protein